MAKIVYRVGFGRKEVWKGNIAKHQYFLSKFGRDYKLPLVTLKFISLVKISLLNHDIYMPFIYSLRSIINILNLACQNLIP